MTIDIYVNWANEEILLEEGRKEWIETNRDEETALEEILEEKVFLLGRPYTDIFNLSSEVKEKLKEAAHERAIQNSEAEFDDAFEKFTFKI